MMHFIFKSEDGEVIFECDALTVSGAIDQFFEEIGLDPDDEATITARLFTVASDGTIKELKVDLNLYI